jgi:hypothetical protein
MNLQKQIILLVAAYTFVVYVFSYVLVCLDPYWYDNGVQSYIDWSERWGWAALIGLYYLFLGLPILFAVIALIYYLYKRKNRTDH